MHSHKKRLFRSPRKLTQISGLQLKVLSFSRIGNVFGLEADSLDPKRMEPGLVAAFRRSDVDAELAMVDGAGEVQPEILSLAKVIAHPIIRV